MGIGVPVPDCVAAHVFLYLPLAGSPRQQIIMKSIMFFVIAAAFVSCSNDNSEPSTKSMNESQKKGLATKNIYAHVNSMITDEEKSQGLVVSELTVSSIEEVPSSTVLLFEINAIVKVQKALLEIQQDNVDIWKSSISLGLDQFIIDSDERNVREAGEQIKRLKIKREELLAQHEIADSTDFAAYKAKGEVDFVQHGSAQNIPFTFLLDKNFRVLTHEYRKEFIQD